MKFSELVKDIETNLIKTGLDWKMRSELVDGRIILPDNSSFLGSNQLELKGGDKKGESYWLLFHYFRNLPMDDTLPVLEKLLMKSRDMNFQKGKVDVEYKVYWEPEDFPQEKELPGLFLSNSRVRVQSSLNIADPRMTIGNHRRELEHKLKAELKGPSLSIEANGNYKIHLKKLIETIRPQRAVLRLSRKDAERIVEEGSRLGDCVGEYFKKALKPKKNTYLVLDSGFGVGFQEAEIIEIPISTKNLDDFYKFLGKPIINGEASENSLSDETGITSFLKLYNPFALIRGDRLKDLQTIVKEIDSMDLGFVFDNPVVTQSESLEMLKKHFEVLEKSYGSSLYGERLISRSRVTRSLTMAYFGEDFFDSVNINIGRNMGLHGFEEVNPDCFLDFLKSKGYNSSKSFDERGDRRELCEKNLFEFMKQIYSENPEKMAEKLREAYRNIRHKTQITAETRKDVSKEITLPNKSRLFSINFGNIEGRSPNAGKFMYNDLSISRVFPSSKDISFFCRVAFDDPLLISLQDYACEAMGVKFR